ncbi:hypothetical protein ISS05_02965 [Candidatus Woesearchaeota archaeon]|nr:hypothetical protein [Candidatus Woesearchaeota archaeon]
MRVFKNKKSSLELSINTIVIVVLAMTLLGLGLGFVRNMFEGVSDTTGTVQEQIKQQILDDLRRGDKKLSFPTNEITIEKGGSKVLAVGIKNTGSGELKFKLELWDSALVLPTGGIFTGGAFIWDDGVQTLAVNEANVYPIKLTAGTGTAATGTTHIVKIKAIIASGSSVGTGGDEYSSKSFFVTVT